MRKEGGDIQREKGRGRTGRKERRRKRKGKKGEQAEEGKKKESGGGENIEKGEGKKT